MLLFLVLGTALAFAFHQRKFIGDWLETHSEWIRAWGQDVTARLTALFINMQIIVLIQSNHSELGGQPTPAPYRQFIDALSIFSLDLIQMMPADCMVENNWTHYDSLLVETLTPIILLTIIFLIGCIRGLKKTAHSAEERLQHLGYFMVAMLLVLPTISRRVCQTFQCRSYDDGDFVLLLSDLATSCKSSKHEAFAVYAILMTCLYPIGTGGGDNH